MRGLIVKTALTAMLLTTQAAASDNGNVFGIAADNDVFIPNGTDRFYTHGTRFSLRQPAGSRPFWGGIPLDRLPIWPKGAALVPESGISQLIFTPARIDRFHPNPTDRPYAGMAALSMGYTGVAPQPDHGPQRIDQFTLTVGIIGPAALAGETQRLVHRVREGVMPLGWRSQLGTEPAVNVTWRRGWRFARPHFDVTPHAGAAMGNVHIHAEAGVTLRIGAGLADLAPGAIDPVQPGLPGLQDTQQLKMHLVAGVDGRAVARNVFIDGNSFTDGRGTVRENVVGQARIGLVTRWRGAQISYLYNWRSREFLRQRAPHQYGSIALAVRL